ncbi:unnamed protein product [Cladocopium goreaui]|uniref:Uncharacterized protein n=1 Tax=Cladocopium goreaui TaxID=2562237 RepID=A0A9P1GQB2_9DINO|nr:unnamed protein product [Cladocopium goreaui]
MEPSKEAPVASGASKSFWAKTCLLGTAMLATFAVLSREDVGAARRLSDAQTAAPAPVRAAANFTAAGNSPAPLLGDGTAVDWWFAFKLTTAAFPQCSAKPSCSSAS